MKILLDENIDPRLKQYITSQEIDIFISSVKDMGWLGMKNGELLTIAVEKEFEIFVSGDKQIKFQQNLSKFNINIILLKLLKNNFTNQVVKIPDLNSIIEKISFNISSKQYYEV